MPTPVAPTLETTPSHRDSAVALAYAQLEATDRLTADHSDDVVTVSEAIGRHMGFDDLDLERLVAAAQLHDVGKVAIPQEILNKPGPLDDDEWAVIREHTVIGERILNNVPELADVAKLVRHSHEHYDGSGYPDGLSGDDIPIISRIVLCSDAFHAIRSDRPYRRGRPARAALAELRAEAGHQFDPNVVEALHTVSLDLRMRGSAAPTGMSVRRSRRLVALLATLALGTTTAIAASPDVRDAIRSVVASGGSASSGDAAPGTAAGLTFGPLGDRLSIAPVAAPAGEPGEQRATRKVLPRALALRAPGVPKELTPLFASPSPGTDGFRLGLGPLPGRGNETRDQTGAPQTAPGSDQPATTGDGQSPDTGSDQDVDRSEPAPDASPKDSAPSEPTPTPGPRQPDTDARQPGVQPVTPVEPDRDTGPGNGNGNGLGNGQGNAEDTGRGQGQGNGQGQGQSNGGGQGQGNGGGQGQGNGGGQGHGQGNGGGQGNGNAVPKENSSPGPPADATPGPPAREPGRGGPKS